MVDEFEEEEEGPGMQAAVRDAVLQGEDLDVEAFQNLLAGARHAPNDCLEDPNRVIETVEAARNKQRVQMAVVSVDIRHSTHLLKESTDTEDFIEILATFFELTKQGVRSIGGWYDKYLGDGFLAYWLPDPLDGNVKIVEALRTAKAVHSVWEDELQGPLRNFTHNWPAGAGISVGIDVGPGNLAMIGEELTVVGLPSVGAARMCSAAEAGETLMNSHAGHDLEQAQEDLQHHVEFSVKQTVRETKEYDRQEVYEIEFE